MIIPFVPLRRAAVRCPKRRKQTSEVQTLEHDSYVHSNGSTNQCLSCEKKSAADTPDPDAIMEKMKSKQRIVKAASSILIIGGGPTGVELAGEVAAAYPEKKVAIVQSGGSLCNNSKFPLVPKALTNLTAALTKMGITVHLNTRVSNLPIVEGSDSFIEGKET